jgi:hypothetical protein
MYFTLLSELSENKNEKITFLEKAISLCSVLSDEQYLKSKLLKAKN